MGLKSEIQISGKRLQVSLQNPVIRFEQNPIVTSDVVNEVWKDPVYQVVTAHNAGITVYQGGVVMLFRSHLRNGISIIGQARSKDGLENWKVLPEPALKPCTLKDIFAAGTDPETLVENEGGGVEDPRISRLGDTYFITYSAYHPTLQDRVRVSLATTRDFRAFTRHGPVWDADMRNVVIFPEKLGDHYFALMRPNDHPEGDHIGGIFREIRLATTTDLYLNNWDILDEPVMKQSGGTSPFSHKIGPGAPPMLTKHGWLHIFHGVRSTMDGNPYVLGVAFHDRHDPRQLIVSSIPVLFPAAADCKVDETAYIHVPNVVFCCGALRKEDGTIYIYYGGNDTVMNLAFSHEDVLFELARRFPQDPLTGIPENETLR
jgi:predicted GH43/DUF377 family glycosyl hydrolase